MDKNIQNPEKNNSVDSSEDKDVQAMDSDTDGSEPKQTENFPENTEIVGVRFKKEGKTYYFDPKGFKLKVDDRVVVDTSRGIEYGYISVANRSVKNTEIVTPLRRVIRIANEEDTKIHSENVKKEIEAYNACIALIDEFNPKMKLVDVEYAFDRSKLLFYFSAEERVDFREIVNSLARIFHTRIEMRQIGIRDEAKMLGGLGVCGRPFCCSAFLTDFVQVSVKMAKEQNISLNSAKISGACGKLMCCLRYEYETYVAEKALTPKAGVRVVTPDGPGEVTESDPLAGIVKVKLDGRSDDSEQIVYVREDVIKEDEYKGEPLTKTEIPKRGKEKEEEDVFASFASEFSNEESAVTDTKKVKAKKKNEEKPETMPQNEKQTLQQKNETAEKAAEEESGSKGNVKNRKKHKNHNRGQNHGQSKNANQEQYKSNDDSMSQNQGHTKGQEQVKNQNQYKNAQQKSDFGENREKHDDQNKSRIQTGHKKEGNQTSQSGNKKKHFKSYHKRFNNGQNSNNGQ